MDLEQANGGQDGQAEPQVPPLKRLVTATKEGAAGVTKKGAQAWGSLADRLENMHFRAEKMGDKVNNWAAGNRIGRAFRFKERNAKFCVELRAGLITFLMVSYILAVNPNILQTTGGTCVPQDVCSPESYAAKGKLCLGDPDDYGASHCLEQLKRNLITATAASSLISTFFIGYFANLPLALAPGMGINAYVAYQVVGQYGSGKLTYQQAMAAIFVEGWIFTLLSITGVRGGIVKFMPKSIALASSVGIGLMLAFTGLRSLGVVVFDVSTLVGLGGCPENQRTYIYTFDAPLTMADAQNLTATAQMAYTSVYGCSGGGMRSPTMWLGIAGGFLMAVLMYMGVKGSLIIGIAFITVISWIPGHSASYLGEGSPIPGGEQRTQVFKQVVAAPTLDMTGLAWDWSAFKSGHLWLALFTFLYIDLLDCTGTLFSMARLLDANMPGFLDVHQEFPGQMWAFMSDGLGIITGSMMGTTPLTVFIESAAGIEEGGRTGVTAIVVAFFFFVSLFFSPILASIPPYATGPALILVGTILLGHIAHIQWDDVGEATPAFLTIILMPFTYSVAYGVIAGLGSYFAIHAPFWLHDQLVKWLRGSAAPLSPRSERKSRRYKSGYHHKKIFGPSDTRSTGGDSLHGYDDSYHSTDSRRSALPPASHFGGSHHGGRMTRNTSFASMEGEDPSAPAVPGTLSLFRRALPPPSPSRTTEGGSGRASAAVSRRTSAMELEDARALPDGRSGQQGSSWRSTGAPGSSLGSQRPATGLQKQKSLGPDIRRVVPKGTGGGAKLNRSRTFSQGISGLREGTQLALRENVSDHGGTTFKMFPDEGTSAEQSGGDAEFKLFGDVDLGHQAEEPDKEFKLFGDVQLPARASLDIGAAGQQAADAEAATESSPSFSLSPVAIPRLLSSQDRSTTADLSFGSPDTFGASLDGLRHGSMAFSEAVQQQQQRQLESHGSATAGASAPSMSLQEPDLQFGSPDQEGSRTLESELTFAGAHSSSVASGRQQQPLGSNEAGGLDMLRLMGSGSSSGERRQSATLADAARSIAEVYRSSFGRRSMDSRGGGAAALPLSAPIAVPSQSSSRPSPFEAAAPHESFMAAMEQKATQHEAGAEQQQGLPATSPLSPQGQPQLVHASPLAGEAPEQAVPNILSSSSSSSGQVMSGGMSGVQPGEEYREH